VSPDQGSSLPRVVIVSANPLRTDQSNGILMGSLFKGWPKDRLAQVFFPVLVDHLPNSDCCREYRAIQIWGAVRRIVGQSSPQGSVRPSWRAGPHFRRFMNLVTETPWLIRFLRPLLEIWLAFGGFEKRLERELNDLKPAIVYALIGNFCLTKITVRVCERLGIPLFIHVTDDFVEGLYSSAPMANWFQSLSRKWFRRAVAYSSGRATISPYMSQRYEGRHGRLWDWYCTFVEAERYSPTPPPDRKAIRLVYSGNLALSRGESLHLLAVALKEISEELQLDVRLDIYCPPAEGDRFRRRFSVSPITDLISWAEPEKLPQIFADSDILVHAESLDIEIRKYTDLSFSTKLSQYMMAGRCILMFGPKDIGSSQMVQLADAGIVIGSESSAVWKGQLRRLLTDVALRQHHAEKGRQFAMKWFSGEQGRERFRLALINAAQGNKEIL
jgi:glycosyltransferase involved in cell wall biosynthesis